MKFNLMYHLPRGTLLSRSRSSLLSTLSKTPAAVDLLDVADKLREARVDKIRRELEGEERKEALRKESELKVKVHVRRAREEAREKNEKRIEAHRKRVEEV